MRELFLTLLLAVAFTASAIDYKTYYSAADTKISAVKSEIAALKKALKDDKNNVSLHKQLVRKQTELGIIKGKRDKVAEAEKKHKELAKQNDVLDREKVKLLQLKQQSADLDSAVVKLF